MILAYFLRSRSRLFYFFASSHSKQLSPLPGRRPTQLCKRLPNCTVPITGRSQQRKETGSPPSVPPLPCPSKGRQKPPPSPTPPRKKRAQMPPPVPKSRSQIHFYLPPEAQLAAEGGRGTDGTYRRKRGREGRRGNGPREEEGEEEEEAGMFLRAESPRDPARGERDSRAEEEAV